MAKSNSNQAFNSLQPIFEMPEPVGNMRHGMMDAPAEFEESKGDISLIESAHGEETESNQERTENINFGRAVQTSIREALEEEMANVVAEMQEDGQEVPQELLELVEEKKQLARPKTKADLQREKAEEKRREAFVARVTEKVDEIFLKAQKLGELQEEVRIAKEKKRERAIQREREQGQIEEALALVRALAKEEEEEKEINDAENLKKAQELTEELCRGLTLILERDTMDERVASTLSFNTLCEEMGAEGEKEEQRKKQEEEQEQQEYIEIFNSSQSTPQEVHEMAQEDSTFMEDFERMV